jgi:hypothetical protein
MHLAVAAGLPATVLYSAACDPGMTVPRGADYAILRHDAFAPSPPCILGLVRSAYVRLCVKF